MFGNPPPNRYMDFILELDRRVKLADPGADQFAAPCTPPGELVEYTITARYRWSDSSAETQPPDGVARIDWQKMLPLDAGYEPQEYGRLLALSLFADQNVREALLIARALAAASNAPLRLHLSIHPDACELHSLYWETLADPGDPAGRLQLSLSERVLFSRQLSSGEARPVYPRSSRGLHALAVVASPSNLAEFNLEPAPPGEIERITSALAGISVNPLPNQGQTASLSNMIDSLRRQPADILFLACHGTLRKEGPVLLLEDEAGLVKREQGLDLVKQLHDLPQPPALVVLVSCQSAALPGANMLTALGPRLVEAGIPAVIAMHGDLSMPTASTLAPVLFSELQRDGQIDRALAVARRKVLDRPDAWMPVLFMRLHDGVIWLEEETAAPTNAQEHAAERVKPVSVNIPPPPRYLLGRDALLADLLLRLTGGQDVAIDGQGGVGKTTLAAALVNHPSVTGYFSGGILWASLGGHPDLDGLLRRWADALQVDLASRNSLPDRAQAIRDFIGGRRFLFVLDDAWSLEAAAALRCGGPECRYLLTTRDRILARRFTGSSQAVNLPVLDEDSSYALLEKLAPEACAADPILARQLVQATGGLSLEIELIGGYLAERSLDADLFPELSQSAMKELVDPGVRLALAGERLGMLTGQKVSLADSLALSLEDLPPEARKAFHDLGVFARNAPFTRPEAEFVTQASPENLALLARRSLVELDEHNRRFRLHKTLAEIAGQQVDPAAVARHRQYYLEIVKNAPFEWPTILEIFPQLLQAWNNHPVDPALIDYLRTLYPYFRSRRLWKTGLEWGERALQAAIQFNLVDAQAYLRCGLALAHYQLGQLSQASALYQSALPMLEMIGDSTGRAQALTNLGVVAHADGDVPASLDYFLQALPLVESDLNEYVAYSWMTSLVMLHAMEGGALEVNVLAAKAAIDRGMKLSETTSQGQVDIAFPRSILKAMEQTILLAVLDTTATKIDFQLQNDGIYIIGVQPEGEAMHRLWQVTVQDGKVAATDFPAAMPADPTAAILTDERTADKVIADQLSTEEITEKFTVIGEREKAGQFFMDIGNLLMKMGESTLNFMSDVSFETAQILAGAEMHAKALEYYNLALQQRLELFQQTRAAYEADPESESLRIEYIQRAFNVIQTWLMMSGTSYTSGDISSALSQVDNAIAGAEDFIVSGSVLIYKQAVNIFQWRASLRSESGDLTGALPDLERSIELAGALNENEPEWALNNIAYTLNERGKLHQAAGRYQSASQDYLAALEYYTSPPGEQALPAADRAVIHNQLAWLLATCTDPAVRDGLQAVAQATRANELMEWSGYPYWDTLAAAYAEAGDFAEALSWQEKALEQAAESEKAEYYARLALYRAGKPVRMSG